MNLWTKAHSSVVQHFHSNLAHYNLTQYGVSESAVLERESRVLVAAARRSVLDGCTQKVQLEGALSPVDGFASTYAVLKTLSPLFSMAALRSEGSSQAKGQRMHCLTLHPI